MEGLLNKNNFQTPIEMALGIDENSMTTARKLYEFLELSKGQFSRWAKTNIIDNEFAEENVDYWGFDIVVEGNATKDYRLTAHFAKKLSIKGTGIKAEQAREYFTQLEERVKQKVIDRSQLSPQMQMFYAIADSQAKMELEQKRQAEQLNRIEQKQETIVQTFTKGASEQETTQWVNHCITKIAESPNFMFTFGNRYAAARNESYQRLTTKAGCRLDQKVRNAIARAEEKGSTQAQKNNINKLTVIMADRRLKEIYVGVIKEMMIAYCVEASVKGEVQA